MQDISFQQQCQICGASFRFGPHLFHGKRIGKYRLMVCRSCWIANWDGWKTEAESKFEAHLAAHGIPLPERNRKGQYPRGDQ